MAKRNLESLQRQYSKSSHGGPGGHGGRGGGPHGRGMGGKPKNAGQTIARLLGYLKPHTFAMILVLICMLTHTITALIGSYLLSPVINHIAGVPMAEDASIFTRIADQAITALTNLAPISALIDALNLSGPFPYLLAALFIFVLVYGCGIVASYTQA